MIDVVSIVEEVLQRTGSRHRRLSVIELNRSVAAQTTVGVMAFLDDRPDPHAFFKMTRDEGRSQALKTEFDNLTFLQQAASDGSFQHSVPEPIFMGVVDDIHVLAESARPGTRMKNEPPDTYFRSKRFPVHFDLVTDWLHRFWKICSERSTYYTRGNFSVQGAIDRFRSDHRVSDGLERLLDRTAGELGVLEDLAMPQSHGDFCSANILIPDDRQIHVIDWEHELRPTWPLADLLHFVASTWAIPYRKGLVAGIENQRALFFTNHSFSARIRGAVEAALEALHVPAEHARSLAVMVWVDFANRKHQEMAQAREEGDPDARHMPLVLIQDGRCMNLEMLAEQPDRFLHG